MRLRVLGAVGLAAIAIAIVFPFTIDDAFIPCRYAANVAAGHGFAFNPGERVEGVTGLAWTLGLANLRALGVRDLPLAAKVLGILFALAAVALAARAAGRMAGGRRGTVGVALLLASSVSFAAYAVAGLETALYTLVVLAATLATTRRGADVRAGLLFGLATWVRPEGIVPFAAACLARPTRAPKKILAALPVLAALAVTKWALFGSFVPATWYARLAPTGSGRDYLLAAMLPTGLAPLLVLGALAVYTGGRRERTLGLVALAMICAVGVVGGDWMPGWRFLVPVWPILSLLAVRGALRLRIALRRARIGRFLGPALLGIAVVFATLTFVAVAPDARQSAQDRRRGGEALVRALRGKSPIAIVDVGWVGWRTNATIVDLGGLTDRTIARARGFYLDKEVSEGYLRRRDPEAIVLHAADRPRVLDGRIEMLAGAYGIEERVLSFPFVREGYRVARVIRHSEGYWYAVLTRDTDRP